MAPRDAQTLPSDPDAARLSLREPASDAGFIDGGWWPRSRDLTVEAPPLIEALWTDSRDMVHVSYNLDYWDAAPRKIVVHGRRVRLAGYHGQNALTVSVSDARHNDTAELVMIAPETEQAVAEEALDLASRSGGTDRAEQLLDHAAAAGVPVPS